MRIGIVSDTHNNLKNVRQIVSIFNEAGVERVIHTGDITQARTVEVFAELDAPLWGVFGNNDQGELQHLQVAAADLGFGFVQPPLVLDWHGRQIVVVHDPLELNMANTSGVDLVLHGHTHLRRIERAGGQLIFNPGECAGMMTGSNAVGLVDLENLSESILLF